MSLLKKLIGLLTVPSNSTEVSRVEEDDTDFYSASERAHQCMPVEEQDYINLQTHHVTHHDEDCEAHHV